MAGIAREVGTLIVRLMAAFPDARRDAKLTLAAYADALRGTPPEALAAAVQRATRELKFFPSAAELVGFAVDHQQALRLERSRPGADGGPPFVAWTSKGEGLRRDGETEGDMLWRMRTRGFKQFGFWSSAYSSPKPGEVGCMVPWRIQREFGFTPVAEAPRPKRTADLPAEHRDRAQAVSDRRVGDAVSLDERADVRAEAWGRYPDTAKHPSGAEEGDPAGDPIV